jgi:hypothetical protein
MSTIDTELRPIIDAFANEITHLVRRAALDAVKAAMGGVAAPGKPTAHRGRPARVSSAAHLLKAPGKAPKAVASKKSAAPKRAPGEKRPPAELVKLTEKLGDYIKAHPGLRMEAIGKALATPTKDLTLPVKKLLAAKKIRVEGEKRATEYFAA